MAATGVVSAPVEFSLRLIGIWPDFSWKVFQRVLWIITLVIVQIFQYWYIAAHMTYSDMLDVLDCMSMTLSYTLLILKLSILWINSRIFYKIVYTMMEDWTNAANVDKNKELMANKANLSRRISISIFGSYAVAVSTYWISSLLMLIVSEPEDRELFFKMEFPFDVLFSPAYEFVMVTQFVQQFMAASMAGMVNALVATLILHVGGQIEIMCNELAQLPSKRNDEGSSLVSLKMLICRHQRIIELSNCIEDVFSYVALVQFLSNILVVGLIGFVIVASLDTPEGPAMLMKFVPMYVVVNFEAFVLCLAGEYLTSKSISIGQAAYKSPWYELESNESRLLLIIIMRSQRRLTITVGKFMDLSLEAFTEILKISVSYVSVLYAMY